MRAKEWLLQEGHIPEIKQGRISDLNHRRLEAAVASGVVFSDYSIASDGTKSKVISTEKHIPDVPEPFWPEDSSVVWADFGEGYVKVKGNMRAVCTGRPTHSLTYCTCEHPRAIVDNTHGLVPVRLERVPSTI